MFFFTNFPIFIKHPKNVGARFRNLNTKKSSAVFSLRFLKIERFPQMFFYRAHTKFNTIDAPKISELDSVPAGDSAPAARLSRPGSPW